MIVRITIHIIFFLSLLSGFGNWFLLAEPFAHFQPHFFALSAATIILALLKRSWIVSSLILIQIVYHSILLSPFIASPFSKPQPSDGHLSVLQFNMHADNKRFQDLANLITQISPDIFVIFEGNMHLRDRLDHLKSVYPYRINADRLFGGSFNLSSGTMFWSKEPIKNLKTELLESAEMHIVTGKLIIEDNEIDIKAVHLPSRLNYSQAKRRAEGIEELAERHPVGVPSLVIGDFNTTLTSSSLRSYRRNTGLKSNFRSPWGLKMTWPDFTYPIGFAIDHLFQSEHFEVTSLEVVGNLASDHRLILTKLEFDPQRNEQ